MCSDLDIERDKFDIYWDEKGSVVSLLFCGDTFCTGKISEPGPDRTFGSYYVTLFTILKPYSLFGGKQNGSFGFHPGEDSGCD